MSLELDLEPIAPATMITKFQNHEFKLVGSRVSLTDIKSRREMAALLEEGFQVEFQCDLITILFFMAGCSMEESIELANDLFFKEMPCKQVNPVHLHGFGLIKLTCTHSDIFRGMVIKQCVFSNDNGTTWTGLLGNGKLITRSAKSWIAYLYDGFLHSAKIKYNRVHFAHDIREWGVYTLVDSSWTLLNGVVYRADSRSLDEIEKIICAIASNLARGADVEAISVGSVPFIRTPYRPRPPTFKTPALPVRRKRLEGESDGQQREKRIRFI